MVGRSLSIWLDLDEIRCSCGRQEFQNELEKTQKQNGPATFKPFFAFPRKNKSNIRPLRVGSLHVKMFSPVDCVRACRACVIPVTTHASNWAWNCGKSPASEMAYRHKWGTCPNPPVRLVPTRHTVARLGGNDERRAGPCKGCNGRYGWGLWPEGSCVFGLGRTGLGWVVLPGMVVGQRDLTFNNC